MSSLDQLHWSCSMVGLSSITKNRLPLSPRHDEVIQNLAVFMAINHHGAEHSKAPHFEQKEVRLLSTKRPGSLQRTIDKHKAFSLIKRELSRQQGRREASRSGSLASFLWRTFFLRSSTFLLPSPTRLLGYSTSLHNTTTHILTHSVSTRL